MTSQIFSIFIAVNLLLGRVPAAQNGQLLSEQTMYLTNRYPNPSVNSVMKENILLTLAYMKDKNATPSSAYKAIQKPMYYAVTLHSGDVFAFHDSILPEYRNKVKVTTNAHFNSVEGFKSDGYLVGDGVCHLASLINLAARNAGLSVEVPTSHDFAAIPGIPKKYGVSIYTSPGDRLGSAKQNLYITNKFATDVQLVIQSQGSQVDVKVLKLTKV